jgi:hypothetical protein
VTTPPHRVVWAYVTLKVLDDASGKPTIRGLSEGGITPPSADPADIKRLAAKGALEPLEVAAVAAPPPDPPTADPPLLDGRPKDYAPKQDWVVYAVSRRSDDVSEEDARAVAELTSKADLIAEFGS